MGLGFGGGSIEAARAFIRVIADNKDAMKSLKMLERRTQRFANRIQQLGQVVATAFASRQAARFLAFTAQAAGNVEIIQRRFSLIFGDMSKSAEASAKTFSDAWQTSITRVREQFARLRALFTPFLNVGATQGDVFRLTKLTSGAIAQFAAATGLGLAEAQDRVISGLTSTGEALDQFGINVRKAAVSQELLVLGINKTILSATEEEKILAKVSIIIRSLRDQNIQVTDTLQLFNVQMTRLKDNATEFAAAIGKQMLPALAGMARIMNSMLRGMGKFLQANPFIAKLLAGALAFSAIILGAIALVGALAFAAPAIVGLAAVITGSPVIAGAVGVGAAVLATGVVVGGAAAGGKDEEKAPERRFLGGEKRTGPRRFLGGRFTIPFDPTFDPIGNQFFNNQARGSFAAGQEAFQRAIQQRNVETIDQGSGLIADVFTTQKAARAAETALEGSGAIAGVAGGAGPRIAESLRFGGGGLSIANQQLDATIETNRILGVIEDNTSEAGTA